MKDIKWLNDSKFQQFTSKNDNLKKIDMFNRIISWILNSYIMPLIKHYFYVTEYKPRSTKIFYFRMDLWSSISKKHLNNCVRRNFKLITQVNLLTRILRNMNLKFLMFLNILVLD